MLLRFVAAVLVVCCLFSARSAVAQPAKSPTPQTANLTVPLRVGNEQVWVYAVRETQSVYKENAKTPDNVKRSSSEVRVRLRVESVTEKGSTVSLTYETVKMSFGSALGQQEFDSRKPEKEERENVAAPMCRPLVGLKLTVLLDANGTITDVQGGEALKQSPGAEVLARFTENSSVAQFLQPVFTLRADRPESKVGDSWVVTSPFNPVDITSVSGTATETRTLISVDRDHAVIDGASTLEAKFDKGTVPKDFKPEFAGRSRSHWSVPENAQGFQGLLGLESKETLTLSFTMPMGAMRSVNEKTERLERKHRTAQPAD